eukprot:2758442-Alexandrium_andersonii.AAC.1
MRKADERLLPVGCGHLWTDQGREVVYSTGGPLPTLPTDWSQTPRPLIRDYRGPGHGVRRLVLEEAWLAAGGTLEGFKDSDPRDLERQIAGDTGARLAGAAALWAAASLDWQPAAG